MLSPDQVQHFKTFGFLVLKDIFTSDEVKTISHEFERRAQTVDRYKPFDGSERQTMCAIGPDMPFIESLIDDDRFAVAAQQLFGVVISILSASANRMVGDSEWHYDAGGYEAYGVKFVFYLESVRARTGALRVIPGSHLRPYHDELDQMEPIGSHWSRQAASPEERRQALAAIDSVPAYVCETDPSDVVAFDLRTFHASSGGSSGRPMCSFDYHHEPETLEELELTILNARAQLQSPSDPWDQCVEGPWRDGFEHRPRFRHWLERTEHFAGMQTEQHGVKAIVKDGKWKVVTA